MYHHHTGSPTSSSAVPSQVQSTQYIPVLAADSQELQTFKSVEGLVALARESGFLNIPMPPTTLNLDRRMAFCHPPFRIPHSLCLACFRFTPELHNGQNFLRPDKKSACNAAPVTRKTIDLAALYFGNLFGLMLCSRQKS